MSKPKEQKSYWDTQLLHYVMATAEEERRSKVPDITRNCPSCFGEQIVARINGEYMWLGVSCPHGDPLTAKEVDEINERAGKNALHF